VVVIAPDELMYSNVVEPLTSEILPAVSYCTILVKPDAD
jgi:hypothetical protein